MHEQFLIAALQQAILGRGLCAPNPSVGAVAVQNNQIIAQAFHQGVGTEHAEVAVLKQLSPQAKNITLYVTLEPCNHWGKTPPCVDAILQYGVSKVVYAYADPNPLVSKNDTPRILREKGVEVIHYPLPVITDFYASYQYWVNTKKPWITVKLAQSLDGKIALANSERAYLSNSSCAQFTHQQRLETDIILTTAATVLKDNPLLNVRLEDRLQKKSIALLDRDLKVAADAKLFKTASHCHIYHGNTVPRKASLPQCTYHATDMQLETIIQHLGVLGMHDVWVEAGAKLFQALHQKGLVNRTYIYVVPKVLGMNALSAYSMSDLFNRQHRASWRVFEDNAILQLDWI